MSTRTVEWIGLLLAVGSLVAIGWVLGRYQ